MIHSNRFLFLAPLLALWAAACQGGPPSPSAPAVVRAQQVVSNLAKPPITPTEKIHDALHDLYMGQGAPDPDVVCAYARRELCERVRVTYDFSRAMVDGGKTGVDIEIDRRGGGKLHTGFSLKAMIPDTAWCAVGDTLHLVNNRPGMGTQKERHDILEYRRFSLLDGRQTLLVALTGPRHMVSDLSLAYLPGVKKMLLVWDESAGFPSHLEALTFSSEEKDPGAHITPWSQGPLATPPDFFLYDPRLIKTESGYLLCARGRTQGRFAGYRHTGTLVLATLSDLGVWGPIKILSYRDIYIESLWVAAAGKIIFKPLKMAPLEIPLVSLGNMPHGASQD